MNHLTRRKNSRSRRGQAISEYLILTALIAVGSIAIVQLLGSNINRKLTNISNSLSGQSSSQVDGVLAGEKYYKVRDLGDFSDAIRDNDSE